NLITIFRVSLFLYLDVFHTDPDVPSHAVDWVLGLVIESKSFALFTILFGAGLSIFDERSGRRLLLRRLLILLVIGLTHLVLVWNGDILAGYAVGGLLALPLIRRSPGLSLGLALAIGVLHLRIQLPDVLPHGAAAAGHGAEAVRIYGGGSWSAIL